MKKEFIKNLLGNSQKRTYRREVFKYWRAGFVTCILIVAIVYCMIIGNPCENNKSELSRPFSQTIENNMAVNATEDKYTARGYARCYDPITCIRDIGEEMGMDNKDITLMVRIAKCESNYREDALGVNTNKTVDRGIFQLNSIHKNISNQDAFNFEKNIKYAWEMYKKQGSTPWNSSIKCWGK